MEILKKKKRIQMYRQEPLNRANAKWREQSLVLSDICMMRYLIIASSCSENDSPTLRPQKPDIDELEHDTLHSQSTAKRSPDSDDERDRSGQGRHRTESAARSTINAGRDQSSQDNRGDSWSSPRSSNRQLPGGYPSSHDLLLGNLGLPFSLGHLASQLTPQQLSNLAPHLGALASQQQLNSLSPQHQELLNLHALKQQQQQIHLQQREQLASIQNSLRGAPNRLATLNLNLSGLGNFGNLGGMSSLGGLASLGDRDLSNLALGGSLSGLPIRKMGGGGGSGSFPSSLTSVTSSGIPGSNSHGGSTSGQGSFNHPSLSNSSSFNSSGNTSQEPPTPVSGADDGSWLDFLSLPGGRLDPTLSGLGPLSTLALGGVLDRDRDSAVRSSSSNNNNNNNNGSSNNNNSQSDASSIFGLHFSGGNSSNANTPNPNAAYGSGVASGGGYGLGVGLGQGSDRGRRTPIERSASRGESMDVDKDSERGDGEGSRRGRSAEREDRDDDGGHSRKRPRWE